MPRAAHRQEGGGESQESLVGDAVAVNGVEDQAGRRTHMREQTMARQAAERAAMRPASERRLDLDRPGRLDAARDREAILQVELTRINADHQTSLRELGLFDFPESEPHIPESADTLTSENQPEHRRKGRAGAMARKDLALVVSAEIDAVLLSAANLTPSGFINQAIDELTVIAPGDSAVVAGPKTTKVFRLTPARIARIAQFAASTGMSKNDVVIAAIRQFARNHPS